MGIIMFIVVVMVGGRVSGPGHTARTKSYTLWLSEREVVPYFKTFNFLPLPLVLLRKPDSAAL